MDTRFALEAEPQKVVHSPVNGLIIHPDDQAENPEWVLAWVRLMEDRSSLKLAVLKALAEIQQVYRDHTQ